MREFNHFCVWLSAYIYKLIKRRWIVTISATLCALLLVLLMKWGIMCTNMHPYLHIQYVCTKYKKGNLVGNMCGELCGAEGISSLDCQKFYMGKEAVFSALWGNTSVVFKSPKQLSPDTLFWLDDSSKKTYPSEEEFSNMIISSVKLKFNISINAIDAKKMSYMHYSQREAHREVEMENVWFLVQDNEYLALMLYEKFDIFPHLVGSCGPLYAVQKLNTVSGFWHLMTLYDSREEWVKRIKISIMILDFLLHLEADLPEPLHICDVKMSHFGVTNDFKKIKYLDLDSVHPVSIVNKITGDGSVCKQHSDCDFFDCRSYCNLVTYKCQFGVANNNLQIVCERIFLGWVMSGRVLVPGLLLGPHAPHVLIELLEQCANPDGGTGTPRAQATKEIRKRLYDLLSHLKL